MILADRFWSKVEVGEADECWPWLAACKRDGYGLFRVASDESMWNAHRVAWTLTHGEIQGGLFVLHRCDNPPCVNPAHLFLGTHADNMADKVAKGRSSFPQPKKQGEGHPLAKLTEGDVAAIRATPMIRGSGRALARRFGVAPSTITLIRQGRIWSHAA